MSNKFKRTILYNIEPIGLNGPNVEALTSYVSRLAEAHSVSAGTLINLMIAPALNKKYLLNSSIKGGSRFYESSCSLNSIGNSSKDLIIALEDLTSRHDLSYLTLTNLDDLIPAKNLIYSLRRWCPRCFEEWKNNGDVIYEPLLWAVKATAVCPRHRVPLQDTCPVCRRHNYDLNRKSRVGFCSFCGSWLGQNNYETNDYENSDYQLFASENVARLLDAAFYNKEKLKIDNFKNNLNDLINGLSNGSVKGFAKITGIPFTNIRVWKKGENKPSLDWLIRISYIIGAEISDLFLRKKLIINPEIHKTERNCKPRRVLDIKDINNDVNRYLSEDPPISVRKLADILGIDKKQLYSHFPRECKVIASRYKEEVIQAKQKRILEMERIIKNAVVSLCEKGENPSRRNIENYIGRKELLREHKLQEIWIDLVENINKGYFQN